MRSKKTCEVPVERQLPDGGEWRTCPVCGDEWKRRVKMKKTSTCPRCRAEQHFGVGLTITSYGRYGEGVGE